MSKQIPAAHANAGFHAWRLFLQSHSQLVAGLDEALRVDAGLPLSWYDVLVHIWEAPSHTVRMRELEDRVFFSQSTVSRTIARMEAAGLVLRKVPENNRRILDVELTVLGLDTVQLGRQVAKSYLTANFQTVLRAGEAELLVDILGRLLAAPVQSRLGKNDARRK